MTAMTILATTGGIWGILQRVTDEIVDERLATFQSLAVILAAMLAALSLIRTTSDYVHGESRFGWQLMRPIVMLLCVMNFSLACTAFEGVVNIFTREIAESSDSSISDLNDAISDSFSELKTMQTDMAKTADEMAEQEGWGLWKKIKEGVKIAASSFFKTSQVTALSALAFVGRLITEMVFFVFQMLAALYLAILRLAGPFIVALSIPDAWKGGLAGWLARYIQISLWIPIGFLVIWMLTAFFEAICDSLISGGLESGIFIIGIGMMVVTVSAVMAVPKIASWFINSAGSGNAQSSLERSLQSIGRRIMK